MCGLETAERVRDYPGGWVVTREMLIQGALILYSLESFAETIFLQGLYTGLIK